MYAESPEAYVTGFPPSKQIFKISIVELLRLLCRVSEGWTLCHGHGELTSLAPGATRENFALCFFHGKDTIRV